MFTTRRKFIALLSATFGWLMTPAIAQQNPDPNRPRRHGPGGGRGRRGADDYVLPPELSAFSWLSLVLGRVDRLSVTDDEVLILDFKTGCPPVNVEAASPQYLAQMALYREGAARIFPGRRIACGLVWTEGPLLMRLPDALMDAQLARIAQKYGPDGAS